MAILTESQAWLLGVSRSLLSFSSFYQLIHLDGALRQEALQHLFIAIAGTDCRELWTLLTLFFGKGTDADPFEFLDAAPAIKKPLDLVDTDSDDESSVADSAASAAMAASSTTSSPVVAKPSTSTGASRDFKLPPKPTWPDLHASIKLAEGCIPRSANLLHHTGVTCSDCLPVLS